MLWVGAGLAAAGIVAALMFLPWRATTRERAAAPAGPPEGAESAHEHVA
jgi:hypothetical protein